MLALSGCSTPSGHCAPTSRVEEALVCLNRRVLGRQLLVRPAESISREDHAVAHSGESPEQLAGAAGEDDIIAEGDRGKCGTAWWHGAKWANADGIYACLAAQNHGIFTQLAIIIQSHHNSFQICGGIP